MVDAEVVTDDETDVVADVEPVFDAVLETLDVAVDVAEVDALDDAEVVAVVVWVDGREQWLVIFVYGYSLEYL